MKCIIIEDQPPAQRILKKYIADIGNLELKGTFTNAIEALDFLRNNEVDLLFLDIHLPKISGLEFLKNLRNSPHVILTTAFPDYALESYELDVIDYLLKPFSFQRFVKAVSKLPGKSSTSSSDSQDSFRSEIFIKSGYEHIKITLDDIVFIKSDQDYCELHTSNKKYLSPEPLRYWEKTLNPQCFTRVHKSYIINVTKIEKISGNQVFLMGDALIPIGRAYKEEFIREFIK